MKYKILDYQNYLDFFIHSETEILIENSPSGEEVLLIEVFLPKEYLKDQIQLDGGGFDHFLSQGAVIPEKLQMNLELFAIGDINGLEIFLFKPRIINIENQVVRLSMQNKFHFLMPYYLFHHYLDRLLFMDVLTWQDDLKNLRIIKDLKNSDMVDLRNPHNARDFSPFESIRKAGIEEVDDIVSFSYMGTTPKINVKPEYYSKYRDYFE